MSKDTEKKGLLKDIFSQCIKESAEASKGITDPFHKALVKALIANSIAQTGVINGITELTGKAAETEETPKFVANSEEAPKAKVSTEKAPEKASDEAAVWDAKDAEEKKESINKFQEYTKKYSEEQLDACVQMFSEGRLSRVDQIGPDIIDAFVAYLGQLENE